MIVLLLEKQGGKGPSVLKEKGHMEENMHVCVSQTKATTLA
jgi:hypothetical protein